jgi:cytochrome c-type biogenesis protein CcmF
MFALGAFVLATVAQELQRGTSARRATTKDPWLISLFGLVRRNRRRYGGYVVHAGLAVLLIGVAASSSFQHSRDVQLKPGQSARLDGYTFVYERPIATASPAKLQFGAVLGVSKGGKPVTTLTTTRAFYPNQNPSDGVIGRFFDSSTSDSSVGLQSGPVRDIWTVVSPNLTPLANLINKGNQVFGKAITTVVTRTANESLASQNAALAPLWQERDLAVAGLVSRYATHPWPVEFLLIVSPMVAWIWFGAAIMFTGGLIALSPLPALARRGSRAPYRTGLPVGEHAA